MKIKLTFIPVNIQYTVLFFICKNIISVKLLQLSLCEKIASQKFGATHVYSNYTSGESGRQYELHNVNNMCNAALSDSNMIDFLSNTVNTCIIVRYTESGQLPLRHHGTTRVVVPHTKKLLKH